jgi:predicted aldo/keto reductase-like oxidoreductase
MGPDRVLTEQRIEMVRHSANCTECRECEQRCPFDLDIVDGLKECRALLEHALAKHRA